MNKHTLLRLHYGAALLVIVLISWAGNLMLESGMNPYHAGWYTLALVAVFLAVFTVSLGHFVGWPWHRQPLMLADLILEHEDDQLGYMPDHAGGTPAHLSISHGRGHG